MSWEIVTGIITLVAFIISIITITSKHNKTSEELSVAIAKLTVSVDTMNKTLESVVDKVEQNSQDIVILKERITK